ncbi:hypothetical protein Esi_0127_0068 [Ectocarpus siliculosus]|uniref:Uncharacterized protein n=1 Tax=Ectocarpus siliculosus TaxID=2880 RepID=D7FJ71_ECTSI|nr:hypothetical protein Esi_0127_0068 [Ectocarpus siliculosus]|eukprot:CBJ28981.1 hypothetical protein Esi_0127_0068 [Ectocarpus siliculosus]
MVPRSLLLLGVVAPFVLGNDINALKSAAAQDVNQQAADATGAVETFGAKLHRHLSPANWLKNAGPTGIDADGNRRLSWNYGHGSSDSGGGSSDSGGGSRDSSGDGSSDSGSSSDSGDEPGPSHDSGGGK